MSQETAYRFFLAVKAMRKSQKDYFRTKSAEALQSSKALEAEVDRYIERADRAMAGEQTLFNQ